MNDPNNTKEKVIRCAIDLFATKGFRGTSIRDIASAMGMSISNIYHYFGSKEGLLLAILQHSSEDLVKELREAAQLDIPPMERFRKLIETHVRLSERYNNEAKIFFLDEEHLSEEGAKVNRHIQRQIYGFYKQVLRELEDAGLIQYRSIKVLAFNIFGIINWQFRWYRSDGSLSMEEIREEIVSFIMNGVLAGAWAQGNGEDVS
ncbi:MAG: TetR family transcriptional regulator [Deltaproteobacteria bacterium]|nr:TetR family transcriptional regulator [Deltaproteobacteria bacterium]